MKKGTHAHRETDAAMGKCKEPMWLTCRALQSSNKPRKGDENQAEKNLKGA